MAKNRRSCLTWVVAFGVVALVVAAIAVVGIGHKIEHDDAQLFVYIRTWRLAQQHEADYNAILDEMITNLPVYPGAELVHEDVDRAINDFEPMDAIIRPPYASLSFGLPEYASRDEILSFMAAALKESGWHTSQVFPTAFVKEKRCISVFPSPGSLARPSEEATSHIADYATVYQVLIQMDADIIDDLVGISEWIGYDHCPP